ncbi:MAG TPA: VWA domain-containing protein [Trueperaceae bacterium]|nr:VWA domain-containing protein [Trueperaceae bacterium]
MRSARLAQSFIISCILFAATAFGQTPAGEPTYIQLILDASGSMFNKLEDGRYRIVAAKDVLTQLISSLPDDQSLNVGLRVYGAERWASDPDACEDTHLVVPLEGLDRSRLLQTVRDTQAQGATPIALSLELAAQDFPAEGRKVIVLITDGIESCRTDLREVAERLRGEGFDVDLRIIGIDLDDFARQAFEGLGTFENATSATELLAALNRAVEVTPAEVTHTVTVTLTREGAPATEGGLVEFIGAVGQEAYAFPATDDGTFTSELPAGAYTAVVRDAFSEGPTTVTGLTVTEGVNEFTFELAPPVEVVLTVSDEAPPAGSTVTVSFEGAPAGRGQVWISPVDSDVALGWDYVDGPDGEVELRVPDEPGTYEAVYHVVLPEGGTKEIGSALLEVQPVTASVEAPAEVGAGSSFEVSWQGPGNDNDYVTIAPAGSSDATFLDYDYARNGNPLSIVAPDEAGDYEVRYVTGQSNTVLAAVPITVAQTEASVSAPAEVVAGGELDVSWTGPGNEDDYVTIAPAGAPEGTYLDYDYARNGNPLTIRAPDEPGDYEVRYVTGQSSSTLATTTLTVTEATASIDGPDEVVAGSAFEVSWTGPDNRDDYVTIAPAGSSEGTYLDYDYTRNGDILTIVAPEDPGAYELRYVTAQSSATLASAPITVTEASASLTAPSEVEAGGSIRVTWEGPDNPNDFVTIVPVGADEGAYLDYDYTRNGSTLAITAPNEPGEYEIRYVTGRSYYTLASVPITVR